MLYFLNLVVENLWNDINFYLSYMGIIWNGYCFFINGFVVYDVNCLKYE